MEKTCNPSVVEEWCGRRWIPEALLASQSFSFSESLSQSMKVVGLERDGSAVKHTGCICKELVLGSQHVAAHSHP